MLFTADTAAVTILPLSHSRTHWPIQIQMRFTGITISDYSTGKERKSCKG